MRRFSKLLFYVALICFLFTVAANFLHQVHVAFLLFLSAVGLFALGVVISLLYAVNYRLNSSGAMVLRKTANLLVLIFAVTTLISVIMSINRIHGARITFIASCYGLIAGFILYMFTPPKTARNVMAPVMYRLTVFSRVTVCLSAIMIVSSLLFRYYRFEGSKLLISLGFSLYILYIILIIFLRMGLKKYPLLNIPAIDIDAGILDTYLGVYYNERLKMYITVTKNETGTSLAAQATGQNAFPLKAIEKNIFNYDRAGIVMEFRPEKGQFILIQNGGYYTFDKK